VIAFHIDLQGFFASFRCRLRWSVEAVSKIPGRITAKNSDAVSSIKSNGHFNHGS